MPPLNKPLLMTARPLRSSIRESAVKLVPVTLIVEYPPQLDDPQTKISAPVMEVTGSDGWELELLLEFEFELELELLFEEGADGLWLLQKSLTLSQSVFKVLIVLPSGMSQFISVGCETKA